MLLAQLKADALSARKRHDTALAALLTTLVAEAERVGKDDGNRASTDAEVVATLKKFIKNAEETLRHTKEVARAMKIEAERETLLAYLPAQASDQEIYALVSAWATELPVRSIKHMGSFMQRLNIIFEGNIDKGMASRIVKDVLSSAA